jgi:hypothetical protein
MVRPPNRRALWKMNRKRPKLRVGDWVEVLKKEEILRTLDHRGQLDGMPFMPEMFAFCGKRLQVYKRAHKTCDTVFPVRGRRVDRAVHLATRCDGSAHGGCQASCLIFWKEAWLKPIAARGNANHDHGRFSTGNIAPAPSICSEASLLALASAPNLNGDGPSYVCQATTLPYATKPLVWWDIRQYLEDYLSGNVSLWRIISGGIYSLYYKLTRAGIGVGMPMRWFYDKFYPLWRGTPFPRKTGIIPEGQATPTATLNLQPGELVRIKSHQDILKTLNTLSRNRGLYWDAEEVPYCGQTHKVLKRVTRIIDERTGKMREMKTPCVILDSVICQSRFSECRMFCPRSIYSYWREIWLERIVPNASIARSRDEGVAEQWEQDSANSEANPKAG